MFIVTAAAVALQAQDGLTLHQVLVDIPHDPAAFVVYAMLIVSGALIWKANRRKTG